LATADINELIGDMIDFYSPQAHSHSITIRHVLHNEPLICKVDTDMLKQVVLNLFINAQQAMNAGGELMIRTDRQQKDASFRLAIPAAALLRKDYRTFSILISPFGQRGVVWVCL